MSYILHARSESRWGAGWTPVAEIEPVLYEKNHPGPRLRAQITVLQAHPADFDQSFTPSLRSMTRGEDRHPISVVIAGVCPL